MRYREFSSTVCSDDIADSTSSSAGIESEDPSTVSQPVIESGVFLRLLSSLNDKNSGFLLALQKFKDQIQVEGERAYPFRIRDLRVLVEFCSHLLSLQGDKQSVDTICGALELFNNDGHAFEAFHLCRLFSSLNNCHGKTLTSSVFKRVVHNKIGMMAARYLSPKKMEDLSATYRSGAECALNYFATALNNRDMEAIEGCCDAALFESIRRGVGYLDRMGLRLNLVISNIKDTNMDGFLLTIGGKRGDDIDPPYVLKQAMAHQIVVSVPKLPKPSPGPTSEEGRPLNRQQSRELVFQTFEKGIVARMDVLLTTRQVLTLVDHEGNVVWQDPRRSCVHKLTFESEIEIKSRDTDDFNTKDWTMVDINGMLNSNAPFTS